MTFINGTLKHDWHGPLKNRDYDERKRILGKYKYSPTLDLVRNDEGLLESLSKSGERMLEDLKKYFVSRYVD